MSFSTRSIQSLVFAALTGTLVATTACNFKYEKVDGESEPVRELQVDEKVGYEQINAAIFKTKCNGCHAVRAPILTTYEQVVANLADISDTVLVKHTMPRRGPLADNLQTMLRDWIAAGAPREGSPVPSANLTGGGIPRPYTFANLKNDVLETKCNACHYSGNKKGITPLDSYASASSVQEWIQPLVFGFSNGEAVPEEHLMPPRKKAAPLSDGEKALILLWYADGRRDENGVPAPAPSDEPSPIPSAVPNTGANP